MFFSGMFRPAGEKSTGQWLSAILGGGGRSAAGQQVSVNSALAMPAVQGCVSLLAETIAGLPVGVYQAKKDDQRRLAREHPVHALVHDAPNGWMTPFEFREGSQLQAGLRGNSYALIERDPDGTPIELIPFDAGQVKVWVGPDRRPYYELIPGQGLVPQRMVHHVRWFSTDGYVGRSPISLHCDALGLAQATDGHAARVFSNGTHLSGVIQARDHQVHQIKDPAMVDRLLTDWKNRYGGQDNAYKVALLQGGYEYKPLAMSNEDAQLLLSRKFSVNEIARIWKVPPHLVGDLERATFSNIEHQQIQFVVFTILPWVKRHEQAMSRDLLNARDRAAGYYIEFNLGGLLRGDQKSRFEAYALGRQWGWLSINDIRRLENLPPVPDGDAYLQPLNMQPLGSRQQPDARVMHEVEQVMN